MRRLIAPDNQGLTLMETLIVIVLIGVLAAIGVPNVFATLSGNRVREGADLVRNALQDAQLQAIRRGQSCTVEPVLASGSNFFDRLRATPVGCFVASETTSDGTYQTILLPRGIRFSVSPTPIGGVPNFRFSFKGHIADYSNLVATGRLPTLVVFAVDETTGTPFSSASYPKKCLMISSMLGMIRGGNYRGNSLASAQISSENCEPFIEGRKLPVP